MPQIQIYLDNKTYINFLHKSDEERKRIRLEAAESIKEEVENGTSNKKGVRKQ